MIFSMLTACSDSNGGGNPMGPEMPDPPVQPPITSLKVELLERLLHDSYSVKGLSRMLIDRVGAEGMREQANLLAEDLDDEELVAFASHLAGLQQLNIDYVNDPGFGSRDQPVISALQLYMSESGVVLDDGEGNWMIGFKQGNE